MPLGKRKWVGSDEGQVRPLHMGFVEAVMTTLSSRPVSGFVEALLYEAAGL